ncbi:MAG: hypothetical protein U0934_20875 [Pseudotabrizicola sp.]|uniref:DUF6880 family protein n=1 Tax=Pseudotabrizicola sp. TaxID=2939647 RepID=UPI00272F48A5|nr:DUF6880 family protein [Pseudotabrizicola sp.]MDP2079610.1 hypothetical protein [Pseudotabrizicola sp.]MDZ7576379.1 hypothetical protein [Pseudotabrizicola sp.]
MAKKTLNAENLETLGAERLAGLVMDLVRGNAALQRRARMELSAAQGPKDIAADLRKRFVSLRRSTSYVDWRKQKVFVKDLASLLAMIETGVAPQDADEAFDLAWSFLQLAPSIHARTDDSNGAIGDILRDAMRLIATLASRINVSRNVLAERILDAVAEAGYGEFDGIIPALAAALGPDGLDHLKTITEAWAAAGPTAQEIARYRGLGLMSSPEASARRNMDSTRSIILADVADAQGDVDAYMARYSAEQLTYGTIAPDVARRLLDAGRVQEAFDILTRARNAEAGQAMRLFRYDLDAVYEECLEKLGTREDLKQHLWETFTQTLQGIALRKYLKLMPAFDDIEAEDRALALAETHPHLGAAIHFLIGWPDHSRAARMIAARADELDGNAYETLTTAADTLAAAHPLAATLLRRAMIQDTLTGAKSTRYRHAARHLAECQASDAAIDDYGSAASHTQFARTLRQTHARKSGFWQLLEG